MVRLFLVFFTGLFMISANAALPPTCGDEFKAGNSSETRLISSSAKALKDLAEEFHIKLHGSPEEKKKARANHLIAADMMANARIYLNASRVSFDEILDHGQPALRIHPGTGRLGDFAGRIKAYDAELLYSPYLSVDLGFLGMAGIRQEGQKLVPNLSIGPSWLVSDTRPFRHYGILHELRHVRFTSLLLRGLSHLYDGHIAVVGEGKFPGELNLEDFERYGKQLSFEEMPAYQTSIYVMATRLIQDLKSGRPVPELEKRLERLWRLGIQSVVNNRRIHATLQEMVDRNSKPYQANQPEFDVFIDQNRLYAQFNALVNGAKILAVIGIREYQPKGGDPYAEAFDLGVKNLRRLTSLARRYDEQARSLEESYRSLKEPMEPEQILENLKRIQQGQVLIKESK